MLPQYSSLTPPKLCRFVLLWLFVVVQIAGAAVTERFEISSNRDFKRIEERLNLSAADEVIVSIAQGTYRLRDSFWINRSNVRLYGIGDVTLRLANNALAPVIAVGSQSSYPLEEERISNISISDLAIDGNRENQKSEYNRNYPWIRNNGIDVRVVSNLRIERVRSDNNRSGGLVISWRCRDVIVSDSVFENNYFDGVAYYDSSQVSTIDCSMSRNQGAGVSLDNAFVDSFFIRCTIDSNRDVGVFARHSERLVFYDCQVLGSGNWAFFLAHDEKERGVFDVDISTCSISGNNGGVRMGSVTEMQSARNSITLSSFESNGRSGRDFLSTAGSEVWVFDEAWSVDNPVEQDGENPRPAPYSQRVSQVLQAFGQPSSS